MMEKLAQLVHLETQGLQVHKEREETEASQDLEDFQERLGHRVHLVRQEVMEIPDSLGQVAYQDQQDLLEIQYDDEHIIVVTVVE